MNNKIERLAEIKARTEAAALLLQEIARLTALVAAQCDGSCHERGEDDCFRCCSGDERMCDGCVSYAAEDAEVGL